MSSPVGSSKASRLFRLDTTRVDYVEADFNTLYSDRNRDFYIYLGESQTDSLRSAEALAPLNSNDLKAFRWELCS